MKRLFAAVFLLLLAFATIPDAAAQDGSNSLLKTFLSAVGVEDGRSPTVILDDDAHSEDRRRGRTESTERTERTETDARSGDAGRGTVEGRRNGEVIRGGDGRGATERGRRTGERGSAEARRGNDGVVTREGDWDDDVYRGENERQGKRGAGPAFCRSGEGHPVFGRDWCRQKGFSQGDRDEVRDDGPWDVRRGSRGSDGLKNDGGWLEDILSRSRQ